MAKVPFYDDDSMDNMFINDIDGIEVGPTPPSDPDVRLWIEITDDSGTV